MLWPAVMLRVCDQGEYLAKSCFVFDLMALVLDAFAASNRIRVTEFMRSGLGSAQLAPADANSRALPRMAAFNFVFIISAF